MDFSHHSKHIHQILKSRIFKNIARASIIIGVSVISANNDTHDRDLSPGTWMKHVAGEALPLAAMNTVLGGGGIWYWDWFTKDGFWS